MQKLSLYIGLAALSFLSFAGNLPLAGNIDELKMLASPEFEGRGVGTKGLEKARDLLAARLKAFGLTPAFEQSYLQSFRVFIGNELQPGNGFAGSGPEDFVPLAFSKSGQITNQEIVFVGFGISARNDGVVFYDDYAGLDVTGKIVVAMMGDPGEGNRDSPFRNPAYFHYSSPMYKVENAELHGAAGIILVRDPLSLSGPEPVLRFQSRQGGGSTSSILAGQASIQFMDGFLGKSVKALQEGIAASQKPNSFIVDKRVDFSVHLKRLLGNVDNVAGIIPGTDPVLSKEYIVIGAHYDHLGFGGDSSMDPGGIGRVHPGADDNASGDQAVLHLAQRLMAEGKNRRSVLVVFFSAEEVGLLGSKNLVSNLPLPEGSKVVAMLNLDMVGRLDQNKLSVLAIRSAKEFSGLVDSVNKQFNFDLQRGDSGFGSSDHASFLQAKIPSLFFTTGAHMDYHRPSDTADKINVDGILRVEDFVREVFYVIDGNNTPPTYDPSSEEGEHPPRDGKGYGVYFGSIPEFNSENIDGVLLQGVRADSPAEKAGLKGGDILTGLGEIKVKNLYDLVFALRFYRPNEEVDVIWMRAGTQMTAKTVLKAREEHDHNE